MATIKITRPHEYANVIRGYKIFIDGQFVGKIANGATKEFPTTAGQHTVTAKMDWYSSPYISVNINTNETKYLTVGSLKFANRLMHISNAVVLLILLPVSKLILEFSLTTSLFLVILIYLVVNYHMTFGRKKYLTLSETQ